MVQDINAVDPLGSILALKKLEENLTKDPASLKNNVNDILQALALHTRLVFTSAEIFTVNGSRLGKHLLNSLILIFSSAELYKKWIRKHYIYALKKL